MSWAKTFQIKTNGTVLGVIAESDTWFIRQDKELLAYNPDENRVVWRLQMQRDSLQMDKTLLRTDDLLIATLHADQKTDRAWLFAVDSESGHMVWSQRVAEQSLQGNGNILGENHWHILFTQIKDHHADLLLLDKSNGEIIKSLPLSQIPKGSAYTEHYYYYHSLHDALRRVDLESGEESMILVEKTAGLALVYDQLLCISGNALFSLDASSSQIIGEIDLNGKKAKKIIPFDNKDHVLVFFEGPRSSVALYDFKRNQPIWETTVPLHSTAFWTGHEVIVKDQTCKRNFSIDGQSGAVSPITTHSFAKLAYFSNGKWFDYAFHNLAVYEWTDLEAPEIDMPDPDESETEVMNIEDFIPGFLGHEDEQKDHLLRVHNQTLVDGNFELLFQEIARCFHIPVVHDKVKKYLVDTCNIEYIDGPLSLEGAKKSIGQFGSYKKLFGFGPEEKLYPALQVGSGRSNAFLLALESGNIISGHQSVLYGEYASEEWELAGKELVSFNQQLEEKYSCFDIQQLIAFQASFEDYKDHYDIPLEELYRQAGCTLTHSYPQLLRNLNAEPMEFLTGYMDEAETEAMIKSFFQPEE